MIQKKTGKIRKHNILTKGHTDTKIKESYDLHITFLKDLITYTVLGKNNPMSDFQKISTC